MESESANVDDAHEAGVEVDEAATSRRGMLRLAGAAAAGAAVAAVGGNVAPANADIGSTMQLGNAGAAGGPPVGTAHASTYQTRFDWNPTSAGIGFFFQAGSTYANEDTSYPCALAGWTTHASGPNGVYGYSNQDGYGVIAWGGASNSMGLLARGNKANMRFHTENDAPDTRLDEHTVGEVIADSAGKLWYCTGTGTPGTWVELSAPGSRYFPLTPGRLYDSRGTAPTGALAAGSSRTVALRDRHDVTDYTVNSADYVPAGATALTVNITVTSTVGAGFLAVNPFGDTTVHAATANWSSSGQTLNAGVNISLAGDRQVTVIAGGAPGASTHFILDVTGYYI